MGPEVVCWFRRAYGVQRRKGAGARALPYVPVTSLASQSIGRLVHDAANLTRRSFHFRRQTRFDGWAVLITEDGTTKTQ